MLENNLKQLSFTDNLAKIYLALLGMGQGKAGEVIKETVLQRSVVYAGLEELVERGLVTKTFKKGVAMFRVNNPETIVEELDKKKFLAEKLVQELETRRNASGKEALIYEGEDVIKRIADKGLSVQPGETVYFMGSSKFGNQSNLEKYWQLYHKKRISLGIKCQILYDHSVDPDLVEERNGLELCEAKYLPFGARTPMWFHIFGDSVAIMVPGENPPLAFLIKNPATARALVEYFQYFWDQEVTP